MPNPSTIPTNTTGEAVSWQIEYQKHDHDYDGDHANEVIPVKRQKLCSTETSHEFWETADKCLGQEPVAEDHGIGLQNIPEESSVLFGTSEGNQEAKSTWKTVDTPNIDVISSESHDKLKAILVECDGSFQSTLEENINFPHVGKTQEEESTLKMLIEEAPTIDVVTSELCPNPKNTSEECENLQSTFKEKHYHFEKDNVPQNLESDITSGPVVQEEDNDFMDKNEKKRSVECTVGEMGNPPKKLKIISDENHETFALSEESLELSVKNQGQSTLTNADKPELNLTKDKLLSGESNNINDLPKLSQPTQDLKVTIAVPTELQHITQENSLFIDADTPELNPTKNVKLLSSQNSNNTDFSKLSKPPEHIKVTASSTKTVKFPENLTQEQAIHILHFLHSYPGTSVLLVVMLSSIESEFHDKTIFIKMYKNKDLPRGVKNMYHAEKQLVNDKDNIVRLIINDLKQRSIENEHNLKVTMYQNNSPCEHCSSDLIQFKTSFESSLQSYMKNPIKFEIAFQFPFKKNSDNVRSGLLKLKKVNVKLASMDWVLFCTFLCEWLSLDNPAEMQYPENLVPDHPGQALDKEVDQNNNNLMSSESPPSAGTETCKTEYKVDEQNMTEEVILTKLHQKTQKWYVHLKLVQTQETKRYIENI